MFFFFQAEDGIRDLTVTGVQTCALPILLRLGGSVLLCLGYIGIGSAGQGGSALVGVSPAMTRVRAAIAQVAATDMPTLILGETGTGKELVAQAIHADRKSVV